MDERDIVRFVEAFALGEIAAQIFSETVAERGLPPWHGCMAPIDYISLPVIAYGSLETKQ